ncbi:Hypothetical predicted protein, partial [Podarcis lilfordi]
EGRKEGRKETWKYYDRYHFDQEHWHTAVDVSTYPDIPSQTLFISYSKTSVTKSGLIKTKNNK